MENWVKKVHVKSSLEPKKNQYAMFVGRWQPLHLGHKKMFQQALDEGKNLLICIREGDINEKNPFTAEQVKEIIEMEYALLVNCQKAKIIIIPDICSVEFGRGVGYDIIEHIPPSDISEISATKIREQLKKEGKL
jgi:adenylylsulfate kinase